MRETIAQTPSRIINGKYSISTEAKHANPAPNKLRSIKESELLCNFPVTFSIYASSIRKTPIKPIQSVVFICF